MSSRTIRLFVLSVVFLTSSRQFASAHNSTLVHPELMNEAKNLASSQLALQFSSSDTSDVIAGAEHEDDGAWWGVNPRYRHHGYNPKTGNPFDPPLIYDETTALERAIWAWDWVQYEFQQELRNEYWEVDYGIGGPWHDGGGFHFLGRTSHLLQDMTSPPHVHAPDGHGPFIDDAPEFPYIRGYYSDFEDYWVANFGLFPTISGSPLFPSDGIPTSQSWNSKLDPYSWGRMRSRIGAQANSIDGFIQTVAWITYFHSSFYGEIQDSTTNAAPLTTTQNDVDGLGMGQPNVLYKMFNELGDDRLQYSGGGLEDDYWVIDGIGWYDKFDLTFNDWWPCDDDSVGSVSLGKITGRFYFYQTWGNYDAPGGDGLSCYPDAWPNGELNSSDKVFAQYYGEFLFPISARYNAGLIKQAFRTISGRVTNSAGTSGISGVSITTQKPDASADVYCTTTDPQGYYTLSVHYSWSGRVFPSKTGYTFTPASHYYAAVTSNLTGKNFSQSTGPVVPSSITLTLSLNRSSTTPSSPVTASGTAYYDTGQAVPSGTVSISVSSQVYTAAISNGSYSQTIYAPSSSGNYTVTASASDGLGRTGFDSKTLSVQPNGSGFTFNVVKSAEKGASRSAQMGAT